jgi:hypothetical protein
MLRILRVAPGNSAPGLARPLLPSVRGGGLPVAGRDGRTVIVLVEQKNWEKKMSLLMRSVVASAEGIFHPIFSCFSGYLLSDDGISG